MQYKLEPVMYLYIFGLGVMIAGTVWLVLSKKFNENLAQTLGASMVGLCCSAEITHIMHGIDSDRPEQGMVFGLLLLAIGTFFPTKDDEERPPPVHHHQRN